MGHAYISLMTLIKAAFKDAPSNDLVLKLNKIFERLAIVKEPQTAGAEGKRSLIKL